MTVTVDINETVIRVAALTDLNALVQLEHDCFANDRLSRRSFKHHILSEQSELVVVCTVNGVMLGYGLVLKHPGTRLARLYSLAVAPQARSKGVATQLLHYLEEAAAKDERHYMRLEVAKQNKAAITLYTQCGYRVFGEYEDYYEDHTDALRMQKRIRHIKGQGIQRLIPWYRQTTEFTCGPAALMMAMASLDSNQSLQVETELDIWREATTIFMTSGHGGCHPMGLALAARQRGFVSEVWLSSEQPLFVDGVRSDYKKAVLQVVHQQFVQRCLQQQVETHYQALSLDEIGHQLQKGKVILILVSTYRFDGKKAPHWVVLTGMDEHCLFVHDPDMDEQHQVPMDCQYVPIAKADFDKMAVFGTLRLRASVTISCS